MTFSFLWFAVGIAVGVNVALAGLWWSLRRENRKEARPLTDAERVRAIHKHTRPLASRRADQ